MGSWFECLATGELAFYLGHVLRIRDDKHAWWRFLVDGHDIPAETDGERERKESYGGEISGLGCHCK